MNRKCQEKVPAVIVYFVLKIRKLENKFEMVSVLGCGVEVVYFIRPF